MNQQEPNSSGPHLDDPIITDVEIIEAETLSEPTHRQSSTKPIDPIHAEDGSTHQNSGDIVVAEKKSLFERLLSPQSLQLMMAAGGGLLVIGLTIWLWSVGVFEDPTTVAISLGVGNLGLLGTGLWLYKKTRYQLAGRGLALLSSLVLPLNLWFYDAQELISLDDGGHLWIPAMLMSGLYAATARITRDTMFVYTLVGGIVLTGLLFLANPAIGAGALWAILPTSTFLLIIGAICTHVDAAFREEQGAFSRKQFGKAFFNAGQMVTLAGIATLAVGQGLGIDASLLMAGTKIWALGAIALAIYTFTYSHIVRPNGALYPSIIIGLTGWIGLITLNVFAIEITVNLILLASALFLIAINAWYRLMATKAADNSLSVTDRQISLIAVPIFESIMLLLGVGQFVAALVIGSEFLNLTFVAQLVATGVAIWTAPGVWLSKVRNRNLDTGIFGGAIMMTIAVVAGLLLSGSLPIPFSIVVVLAIALIAPAILIAGAVSTKSTNVDLAKRLHVAAAGSTTVVASTAIIFMAMSHIPFGTWSCLGLMAMIAAIYVYLERVTHSKAVAIGAVAASAIAISNLVLIFNLTNAYAMIIGLSCIGMGLLLAAKFFNWAIENRDEIDVKPNEIAENPLAKTGSLIKWDIAGNVFILAGAAAAILFACTGFIDSKIDESQIGLLAFQLLPIFVGWAVNKHQAWKRTFVTAGAATFTTGVIALASISTLTIIQRFELGSLIVGLVLVVLGYIGWSMEKEEKAELVSFNFILGSLLLAVPMILGLIAHRVVGIDADWRQLYEIGGLIIGLGLLGSGILSQVRSTTIAGGALMATYVASIFFLIQWPAQLQSVSVMMMLGGGTFFAVALLLSFYRDRILSLPERVRDGRGLFRVLKWR